MFENFSENITALAAEKGISSDLILEVIKNTLIQALKRRYKDHAEFHIEFDENLVPLMYRKVTVVENVTDDMIEIGLDDAKKIDEDVELGEDVWLMLDNVEEFGRIESTLGKTTFHQELGKIEKDIIYNEFKRREDNLVNGYYQREHKGIIFVNLGKTEGVLLRHDQSPREHYMVNDKIRAYIYKVEKREGGHPSIYLTRTRPEFLKKLFELDVPEISDGTVTIHNIARQAGMKSKVAVSSSRPEVDPVGACVGQKGVRIQSIIKEIEGEKIDIIKFSRDVREYIANAVSPAKCLRVIVTDAEANKALVVVPDDQLSLAIGKGGVNIRLAAELVGYSLDIKTETDVREDPELSEEMPQISQIFSNPEEEDVAVVSAGEEDTNLYSIESLEDSIIERLLEGGIDSIETLYQMSEEEVMEKSSLSQEEAARVLAILKENVVVVEEGASMRGEEGDEIVEEFEIYECPNCGAEIHEGMDKCSACGVEISFE